MFNFKKYQEIQNFISKNLKKIYDKFFNKKVEIQRLKNKTRIYDRDKKKSKPSVTIVKFV